MKHQQKHLRWFTASATKTLDDTRLWSSFSSPDTGTTLTSVLQGIKTFKGGFKMTKKKELKYLKKLILFLY